MSRDKVAAQRERLAKLAELADAEIDTSDIPEASPGAWAKAEFQRFYRPRKEAVTIRLDADVIAHFRRAADGGRGYQTAINAALRDYVKRQR